jgi:DNA-binding protein H-NS
MATSNPVISIAKSKAMANRLVKDASEAQVLRAISNLQAALKTAKAREAAKLEKKKAANMKKLTAMMAEMGLSGSDVAKLAAGKRTAKKATRKAGARKGQKVAPKYSIKANGETIQWTGRGRMPVAFREFVAKGGSLQKCLIK